MKLAKLTKTFLYDHYVYRYTNNKWSVCIEEDNDSYNLSMISKSKTIELKGFELDELLDVIDVYI